MNSSTRACTDLFGKDQIATANNGNQHARECKIVTCDATTSFKSQLTLQENNKLEGNKNGNGISFRNSHDDYATT